MGWKTDTVLIRPGLGGGDDEALLQGLGFSGLAAFGEATLKVAFWPDEGRIWIGEIGDCLWISARGLTDPFFKPSPAGGVRWVLDRFPTADTAALLLNSVVDLWGFAVYRAGAAVRRMQGAADYGGFVDFGAPLPEELVADSPPGDDDQDGEEIVFRLFERFLGMRPDRGDGLLKLPCRGYSFAKPPAA